jgi:hypothetical protein
VLLTWALGASANIPVPTRPDGGCFSANWVPTGIKSTPSPSPNRGIPHGELGIGGPIAISNYDPANGLLSVRILLINSSSSWSSFSITFPFLVTVFFSCHLVSHTYGHGYACRGMCMQICASVLFINHEGDIYTFTITCFAIRCTLRGS